uniref:Uncharacterized protein n=1 Tax=Nelumbo nucifera TaxID=4432 RepID=A0A822XIV9_NELNU|nr:TPA_asm: hypothetical protein HUJ06_021803 [Nelumbo nucifera]
MESLREKRVCERESRELVGEKVRENGESIRENGTWFVRSWREEVERRGRRGR